MAQKRKRRQTQSLPRYVQEVKQADGVTRYRSWFPLGAAGQKKWTRLVDTPEDALAMRLEAIKLASELPRHVVTLGQAIERTKAEVRANNRPGHVRWFTGHAAVLERELGAETPLESIRPATLERFKTEMLERVSASTVLHYKRALSMVLNHAIRRGDLADNVLRRVRWPKAETKEAACFPAEEVSRILGCILDSGQNGAEVDHDVVAVLYLTGLRLGELARLEVADVDVRGRCAWVRGKARAERVALGPEALQVVRRMVTRVESGPLVPGGEKAIASCFRRWGKRLGLERFSAHAMRHSFITALVESGLGIERVQKLARHKTIAMTARYYHGRGDEHEMLGRLSLKPRSPNLRAVE